MKHGIAPSLVKQAEGADQLARSAARLHDTPLIELHEVFNAHVFFGYDVDKQRVTAKLDGVVAHGVHMEEAVEQLAKLLEVKYPGRWV